MVAATSSLRDRRRECGLTQGELATRAGVSRQLVAAVEAGRNAPAVDAALALARALATTVEELFAAPPPAFATALGERLPEGTAVRVGRVGDQTIACELADHGVAGAGWARPDGVIEAGALRLLPGARPAGVVLAGCDPAFGLIERLLDGLGPRSLLAISAPTGRALRALTRGTVHAAVVHGPEGGLPQPPLSVARWHVARWQVGLGIARGRRRESLQDWVTGEAPLVQRDATAASQQAFERARRAAGVQGRRAGPRATGHLDASRTAALVGGAAVTTEGAARTFGLRFAALEEHVVELWVAERWREHPGVHALADLLGTAALQRSVALMGGYDLTRCGDRVTG